MKKDKDNNDNVNWKILYDTLSHCYEKKEQELANLKGIISRNHDQGIEHVRISMLREIYEIYDNLKRLHENAVNEHVREMIVNGILIIMQSVDSRLAGYNVKRIDAVPGSRFDPRIHDAVEVVNTKDIPSDHIIKQVRCGYLDGDKMSRAAQVSVSRVPD